MAPDTALTSLPTPASAPRSGGSVRLRGVSRSFPARGRGAPAVTALSDVDLTVAPGEVVAVVGPSGCGKTTLLELVCGLQRPDAGTVEADPAALMAQRDLLLPWAGALDNAALALRGQGMSRAEARERARPLLHAFGLEGFEAARPHELSGGMRQRVAFARTLLAGRPVLCLDEPLASLDALTRHELQTWLTATLARDPHTVLLVTHDVEEALLLADRVIVLSARPGRVVATLEVAPARPRRRTDPELVALREQALRALGMPV